MKKIILRYGILSVLAMVLVFGTTFFIFRNNENFDIQEVIGYTAIVLSLLFVFFAIKQWRDQHNNGVLSFGRGLGIGTLVTLFPSVAFGAYSYLEVNYIDPGFNDRYYSHYIEKVKQTTPPEKLQAALDELASSKEMFTNPFFQFFAMFLTVFVIGVIISVISSLILRRQPKAA